MKLPDTRRLTGRNLLWDEPGATLDIECAREEAPQLVELWSELVRDMLDALGWQDERTCTHRYDYGVSLAISAPIDSRIVFVDNLNNIYLAREDRLYYHFPLVSNFTDPDNPWLELDMQYEDSDLGHITVLESDGDN